MKKRVEKSVINVAKAIAVIVGSRDLVDQMEKAILKTRTKLVHLDFSEVEFVSRSATHSLLVMKENFSRKTLNKKELSFVNANKDVEKMFRVVAANRALPKKKTADFNPEKIDISSLAACKNC